PARLCRFQPRHPLRGYPPNPQPPALDARPAGRRRAAGNRPGCAGAAPARGSGGAGVPLRGREADLGLLPGRRPAWAGLPVFGADLARWSAADPAGVPAPRGRSRPSSGGERRSPLVLLAAAQAVAGGLLARARASPELAAE